jgi:mannose-6-phosphate isomerase
MKEAEMIDDDSFRPWGRYEVLQDEPSHKVKCIYVTSGCRLSYQRHQKRQEHWFIVSGVATVTLDGQVLRKLPGETVDVGVGVLHRIGNEGPEELVFVEVQTGTYFGEDDIERIEDDYSR